MSRNVKDTSNEPNTGADQPGVSFHGREQALKGAAKCVLVCPEVYDGKKLEGTLPTSRDIEGRLAELEGLALAINLEIVDAFGVKLKNQHPATLVRGGTVEKLHSMVETQHVQLIIVDAKLSPIQQRNLEVATGAKILDRTGLILEIFGQRAQTREGVLQVELAHLSYQKGRLVRSWTHLERQRGGAGFMGGPGETQIEADRRQLSNKIERLKKSILNVRKNRAVQRQTRLSGPVPTIALVGYTNAGKSTLFNRITQAGVLQKDQLFATLDTTHRKIKLPGNVDGVLSDTVGFISDLPTELVAAFHATLEDVGFADLILHIHDSSHHEWLQQHDDVIDVLEQIGIDTAKVPMLNVWNKWDQLDTEQTADRLTHIRRLETHLRSEQPDPVTISAHTGLGMDALCQTIADMCTKGDHKTQIVVPAQDAHKIHWLYQHAHISAREDCDDGSVKVQCAVPRQNYADFISQFGAHIS